VRVSVRIHAVKAGTTLQGTSRMSVDTFADVGIPSVCLARPDKAMEVDVVVEVTTYQSTALL
jgi:hypothetical protein